MAKQDTSDELSKFRIYINSDSKENAKRDYLYPIFRKLFKEKFKYESDAHNADAYVQGVLILEAKSNYSQWLEGFYQALHYHRRFGLTYNTVIVVAKQFVGIWKLNKIPESATKLAHTADAHSAPTTIGKENAKKTDNAAKVEIKNAACFWLEPKDLDYTIFNSEAKSLVTESYEILNILNNIDSDRILVTPHNFINTIERLKPLFDTAIDAVHAFYSFVAFWDITSTLAVSENNEVRVVGFKGNYLSENIAIPPRSIREFRKFIETQYIFTNEGSGLTSDYYFSRFDEVLAKIDPEYVKQHGIFFTDGNLSKFALWFAKQYFPGDVKEDYIVFDPAAGSGNLVSSWRGKLKHKIVSELQPDLLRIIERRMSADPFHLDTGFTIVPRTSDNKGLNFLDISGEEYLSRLANELANKQVQFDKPIAFLLNPPYKNTKENESHRNKAKSDYTLHPSIISITGEDAVNERYLAFLGQIINMSIVQDNEGLKPIVMVFTPTSWLIPRPAFKTFRQTWDSHFRYEGGFIITSNEFFKLDGKWPLAFTMWSYSHKPNRTNKISLLDLTHLNKADLNEVSWYSDNENKVNKELSQIIKSSSKVNFANQKQLLREKYDLKLYDFIRTPNRTEKEGSDIVGGLPLADTRRDNNKTYGTPNSEYVGFLDNGGLARIRPRGEMKRFSKNNLKSIWFRLDTAIKDTNKSKCFNGPADNRSYAAYDLESARATCSWFCITKAINGVSPLWANQFDVWAPEIPKKLEGYYYSLCFAFVLAENRCIVSKFEKDNPVKGAPEVFVDNPLCPNNKDSFWNIILDKEITQKPKLAFELVEKVKELYKTWNKNYCKGQTLKNRGLENEPYFMYFKYEDFLTPHSGLVQIRKYTEQEGLKDMQLLFTEVSELAKKVKSEIYRLLVEEFEYFK